MEALLIIDIQNDFLPGGSLAVEEGDKVVPIINILADQYELVVATQDWHPPDHKSFASQHKDKKVFDTIELLGLEQVLWPDHCVQGSKGAEFSEELDVKKINKVFQKGTETQIDSYSGFFDNGHKRSTGLHDFLQEKNVEAVVIAGLATDYCVRFTALDALDLGYKTTIIANATRAVGGNESQDRVLNDLKKKGAHIKKA